MSQPKLASTDRIIADRVAGAERVIAAAALYGRETAPRVLDAFGAADMRDEVTRAVWGLLREAYAERQYVSELDLISRGLPSEAIAPIKVMRAAAQNQDPDRLIHEVRAMHLIDDVARVCVSQAASAREQSTSLHAVRGWTHDLVRVVEAATESVSVSDKPMTMREAFVEWLDSQCDDEVAWRCTWGVPELDERLGGIQPGTMHVPIGLPSHGKSVLAVTAAYATAAQGRRVLYVSREMREKELGARFGAIANETPTRDLAHLAQDGENLEAEIRRVSDHIVPDCRSRDLMAIRSHLRLAQAQGDPYHLVILDYLQLFHGTGDNRVQELESIAYGAKDMAMDLDVAVINLAQVNRQNDGKHAPTMREIKGASAIEDAADSVISIFREMEPKLIAGVTRPCFGMALNIEKARNGQAGPLDPHLMTAGTFRMMPLPSSAAVAHAKAYGSHAEQIH